MYVQLFFSFSPFLSFSLLWLTKVLLCMVIFVTFNQHFSFTGQRIMVLFRFLCLRTFGQLRIWLSFIFRMGMEYKWLLLVLFWKHRPTARWWQVLLGQGRWTTRRWKWDWFSGYVHSARGSIHFAHAFILKWKSTSQSFSPFLALIHIYSILKIHSFLFFMLFQSLLILAH